MLNQVILEGRLAKDPELRKVSEENTIANFTIAVDNITKDKEGNRTTSFINCVAFGKTGGVVIDYCKKGMLVSICGRLMVRSYVNKEDKTIYVTEVHVNEINMLEPKKVEKSNGEREEPVLDESSVIKPKLTPEEQAKLDELLAKKG